MNLSASCGNALLMLVSSTPEMALPSQLIFGTMRMSLDMHPRAYWETFFEELYVREIQVVHSSSEYESFELLCSTLQELNRNSSSCKFRHVIKLAEPSFGENGFKVDRLQDRLESYRDDLGADQIDDVQWMWRQDLHTEGKRLQDLESSLSRISEVVAELKERGTIKRFLCFPYTVKFGINIIDSEFIDGFTVYRNRLEREYDGLLDMCQSRAKRCLAIRPFAAGDLLNTSSDVPRDVLSVALDHPAVEAAIFSTSNLAHLDELMG